MFLFPIILFQRAQNIHVHHHFIQSTDNPGHNSFENCHPELWWVPRRTNAVNEKKKKRREIIGYNWKCALLMGTIGLLQCCNHKFYLCL
jgi:hypothetical protein